MNKSLLFIDTWGWLTLYDRQESAHQQTVKFYQDFWHQKGNIYTTDYVLDETFTLLFKRLNNYQANQAMQTLLKSFENQKFHQIFINEKRFAKTCLLRSKYIDKPRISFTDLSSMVVMKEYGITFILTGDDHFNQVGMGFIQVPNYNS